jgi:HlyD family secretion protein
MKRKLLIGVASLAALAAVALLVTSRGAAVEVAAAPEPTPEIVAGPGSVEPASEELRINAQMSGRLRDVVVEEGDRVERGQLLAVLENDDFAARVALAEAELRLREAELRRVQNGARLQERQEALAGVKEAEAVLENARVEWRRRRSGFEQGVFAKEEADRAERELGVAQARLKAAQERYDLLEEGEREEDRARAEANVELARARVAEARAVYEKTFVRAPSAGVVLRKRLKAGESYSDQQDTPVVILGDLARLRVRMDVDENDIARLRLGQRAYVTADAFPGQKFRGTVVEIGQILGPKNVRTEQPGEFVDRKILETLIELEPGAALRPGLRVDAFIVLEEK